MTAQEQAEPMSDHIFTLFIAGGSELADRATANFDRIIRSRLQGACSLKVIDISSNPHSARQHRVIATPLLVREQPAPLIKILGDLSQEEKIVTQLGLKDSADITS
jgi:circadian clock protein KaiB